VLHVACSDRIVGAIEGPLFRRAHLVCLLAGPRSALCPPAEETVLAARRRVIIESSRNPDRDLRIANTG
jgi:hypothetical protein